MSFILDALKKSENDRQRQSAPALFEVKVAAPRRRLPLWAVGLAVLLGVNALILGWVLLRDGDVAAPAAAATKPDLAPSAVAATTPAGAVTVPATVTFQVNVPAGSAPAAAGVPETVPSVPPDYDARDYQPAITPEQAAATAAARRAGHQPPTRDEMLARGAVLPEMRLDLHVYDPDPAKRFVFINMRKLREGESLPDGVRVDEITQGGAKLTYRGTQFALHSN
jgi:general secretion pathway protein B